MGRIQEGTIEKAIQQAYRLAAPILKPHGAVWKVHSASGCFILKPVKQTSEQIRSLDWELTQIRAAGFEGVPEIFKQRNGQPFMEHSGEFYILMPWYPGDNPSFQNLKHSERIAALYGLFHRTSREISKSRPFSLKKWVSGMSEQVLLLEKTIERLHELQLQEPQSLNRIDRAIENWGQHFLQQARFCLAGLTGLSQTMESAPAGFCHNDPAPRNIIIQSPNWMLIDFELGGTNLYIKELAVLLLRILAANQWQIESIRNISNIYGTKRPMEETETKLFPYLLGFPQGYWRLCSQRYTEKLQRKEHYFQEKLWTLIHQEPGRLRALASLCPEWREYADFNTASRLGEYSGMGPEPKGGTTCP